MAGVRIEFAHFGDFDSFDILRASAPMDINSLPSPIATELKTMSYVDTAVVKGEFYYYRARVWRGIDSMVSDEVVVLAGKPWTPDDIAVFFRFDNKSDLVVESTKVRSVRNSNITNDIYFTQPTGINKPTLTAYVNGIRSITFDGVNNRLNSSAAAIKSEYKDTAVAWCFLVIRRLGTDNNNRIIVGNASANYGGGGRFNIGSFENHPYLYCERLDYAGGAILISDHTFTSTEAVMIFVMVDFSQARASFYINGVSEGDKPFGTAGRTDNTVGVYDAGISNFAGSLMCDMELLALLQTGNSGGLLPTEDIDRLFGYYAHQYNLTDNLQASHPYKYIKPLV